MRRRLAYVLAWSLATAVAITGSWVGLQPLLAAATPQLPASLSASQLREAAPSKTPSPSPSPSPSPTASPTPSPTPVPPVTVSPVTVPPGPQMPASSEWERVEDSNRYERRFVVRGGEVVFRASHREVRVVSHTANPGYEATVNRWTRSSVIFSFESTEHTSRIWVMWRNGPYAEVTETV